jgi:DNA polymerase-3 subunit delta
MFQEKKYIIAKNANFFASDKINEEDLELLENYMNNPISLTTIIFTTYEKIDLRKKITKTFKDKYKIINVGSLSLDDLTSKIREYAQKNKYKISNECIQYIMNACNNNYDLIYNELNKLFLYYNEPQNIKLEDVHNIVSKSLIDNNFKFVEAVIAKNLKKASNILEDLYTSKVDPIALIMLLAREYRLMLSVNILMSSGYHKNDVGKELSLQEWQVDKLMRSTASYYNDELKEYLKELSLIDYKIKSGEMDKFLGLKTFLLGLE